MKLLPIFLLFIHYSMGQSIPDTAHIPWWSYSPDEHVNNWMVKDSTWGDFNRDTIVTLDSSKGYLIRRMTYPYGVDSSNWKLLKIEGTPDNHELNYTYFKTYFYGKMCESIYPEDSIKIWQERAKKGMFSQPLYDITMYGYSDLMGYFSTIYRKTNFFLPNVKISDTIPQKIKSIIYSDIQKGFIYTNEYYVGGIISGVVVRKEFDHFVKEKSNTTDKKSKK